MKRWFAALLAACACATAQNMSALAYMTTASSYSVSTWTSDDCTSLPDVTLTATDTLTVTYCSECEAMPTGQRTVHTTVYTAVFTEFCPSGTLISGTTAYMTPHTYTITETCSMATPFWSTTTSWIPESWTTEVQVCHVCGEGVTATITFPASCTTYPPGVTAATPSPVASSTSCTETTASVTAPAYKTTPEIPATITSGVAYSSGLATPSVWGNTTGITSYTGRASTLSAGWFITVCSIAFIGAGAFLL